MSGRYATAIYSDDIRYELGKKVSFIGVYGPVLLASEFPLVLPKLCVSANAWTTVDHPFESLAVKVFLGDKVLVDEQIPQEMLQAEVEKLESMNLGGTPQHFVSIGAQFQFAPLRIENESNLRIRIQTESEELTAPSLVVRKQVVEVTPT